MLEAFECRQIESSFLQTLKEYQFETWNHLFSTLRPRNHYGYIVDDACLGHVVTCCFQGYCDWPWLFLLWILGAHSGEDCSYAQGNLKRQLTMSHTISKRRKVYILPSFSIRWYMYSGCNLWYFKLARWLSASVRMNKPCAMDWSWKPEKQCSGRLAHLEIWNNIPELFANVPNVVQQRIEALQVIKPGWQPLKR
jgi:hypothetical protein